MDQEIKSHNLQCESCTKRKTLQCPIQVEENYYKIKEYVTVPHGWETLTSVIGCASHSDAKKLSFKERESLANQTRLEDKGYVKCDFGDDCEDCEEYSEDLYTQLDWETGEAQFYLCPYCALKREKEARLEGLHLDFQIDMERNEEIRKEMLNIIKEWFKTKGKMYWESGKLLGYIEFEKELMALFPEITGRNQNENEIPKT